MFKKKVKQIAGHRAFAVVVVLMAFFMDLLDSTIVNIAIPSMQHNLGTSYADIQWVIAGYSLAFALTLVTGGRLGDIFGYKKLFLIGMAGFTLASILSGAAVSPLMLILARLFQGTMAAVMVPQVLSTIQVLYQDAKERAKISGLYGALGGLASVAGPILGALLISANPFNLEWRSIFYVNVPLGILALLLGAKVLPKAKSPHPLHVDLIGVGLISTALLLLIFPLLQGRDQGWPLWTYLMMLASLPVFAFFGWYQVRRDKRDGSPLVVPELFHERTFIIGLIVAGLFFAVVGSFFLTFTLFLQLGLGYSVLAAGLTGIPFSIGIGIAAGAFGQRWAMKYGRVVLTAGALIMAAAVGSMVWLVNHFGAGLTAWELAPSLLAAGFGMGLIISPIYSFVLAGVHIKHAGSASGIINTSSQIGSAIGVALIGVVFFGALTSQALPSAQGQAETIRRDLTAAHIPAPAQERIVQGFNACFVDRTKQNDASITPDSCKTDQINSQLPPSLAKTVSTSLTSAGTTANTNNFINGYMVGLAWISGALITVAALTFLLPKRVPQRVLDIASA